MKRIAALIMAVMMLVGSFGIISFADENKPESITSYVTISDGSGKLQLKNEKITVTDVDKDGKFTCYDALYLAHEAKFEGGAKEGFATDSTGSFINKLWGVVNGGSYGFYFDDKMAMSLKDEIKDGSFVNAYILQDTAKYSDKYVYFNIHNGNYKVGESVKLTLTGVGFDEMFNTVISPVKNAVITVNGEKTELKTNDKGEITYKFDKEGEYLISAVSDKEILVPACLTVKVTKTPEVYVTVSDDTLKLVAVQEKITLKDMDGDGLYTINDALILVHDAKFEGGSEKGFKTEMGKFGLFITKLWGIENGGSYGYYVNDQMAMGLTAPVNDGDYIKAYAYKDAKGYSDIYTFFDKNTDSCDAGSEITLTLKKVGFDENYNAVNTPVENAVITVNGEKTTFKTDAEGKVTVKLDKAGKMVISAVSETEGTNYVPPCVTVDVKEVVAPTPETPETKPEEFHFGAGAIVVTIVVCAVVAGGVAYYFISRKKK